MEELLNKMHVLIDKFRLNYDDNGDINMRIDDVVKYLFKYYKGENLLILSFCDSDGISYLHPYIQKDFLGAIRSFFLEFRMHMNLINGCNVVLHQPEYIDSLLSHNVRISDIKRINKDSYISKMEMMNLPDWVVSLGNVYKLRERIRKDDYNLGIRDVLRNSYEPFIIYNCGYSDLIAGENLDLVMDKIQKNIEHFLSINSKSDIVILGSNIHKGDFKEIISQYNDSLKNLCNQYNISYIDPFYINYGYKQLYYLSALILEQFYFNKKNCKELYNFSNYDFYDDNLGIEGIVNDFDKDLFRKELKKKR